MNFPQTQISNSFAAGCRKAGPTTTRFFGFRILGWLALLFAAVTVAGQEVESDHLFHFGTSSALLRQFNENDARAALKVWAETLVKDGAIRADPTMRVYDSVAPMIAALQNKEVDGVSVPVNELFEIQEQVKFDHFIFDVVDGSITEEYVVLVQQDSSITNVEDLREHSLIILRSPRTILATTWLDTLLLEKGLKPAQNFCSRVTEENKLTKTILPVFFRQTDACLVSVKGFKTMGELNPQVSRQLRVLATSPKFATTGFFLRSGPPEPLQARIVEQTLKVHETAAGQQILTVFQTERLVEQSASVLDSAFALLARHRQLLAGTNNFKTAAGETNSLPRETNGGGN